MPELRTGRSVSLMASQEGDSAAAADLIAVRKARLEENKKRLEVRATELAVTRPRDDGDRLPAPRAPSAQSAVQIAAASASALRA